MINRIKKWLNRKGQVFNIYHPDLEGATEEAFKAGGVTYYRFKDQVKMPTGRYKWVQAYLQEAELHMTLDTLKDYVRSLKDCISGAKGSINLELMFRYLLNMETRLELAFEPERIKRLATVVYFTEDEILSTYDQKQAQKKLDSWEKCGTLDFFLTRPISELLNLNISSVTHLEAYLSQAQEILRELTLEQLNQSGENS